MTVSAALKKLASPLSSDNVKTILFILFIPVLLISALLREACDWVIDKLT